MHSCKNMQVQFLSGGEKRKLSVALSFIGNSSIIFLDEPSSGLDVQSKRLLWDIIKNYKTDKILVLITHYMDEADYLGDRIGIMGEGHLMTCGTSLFLKQKYGVGYQLNIVKKDQGKNEELFKFVSSLIPTAKKIPSGSKEQTFQLPLNTTNKFQELFTLLSKKKEEFSITEYGISATTLEEVFLKVAAGIESIKPEIKQ